MTHKEMCAMRLLRMLLVGTLSSVLLAPRLAAAPAQAPKTLVVTARNLTAETARVAKPGDVIRYRLVFTNVTAGPVKNIQFVDPIPSGMVYVLGSATSDQRVRVEYSIDSGRTYAARPTISVVESGNAVQKPAPPARYTNDRWHLVGSLARGAQVTVEFHARVSEVPGQ